MRWEWWLFWGYIALTVVASGVLALCIYRARCRHLRIRGPKCMDCGRFIDEVMKPADRRRNV